MQYTEFSRLTGNALCPTETFSGSIILRITELKQEQHNECLRLTEKRRKKALCCMNTSCFWGGQNNKGFLLPGRKREREEREGGREVILSLADCKGP